MRALIFAAPFLALAVWGVASKAMGGHHHLSFSSSDDSGPASTRRFATGPFEAVSLEGSDDVRIIYGPAAAVSATGSAKDLDRLDIRVEGNMLKIGRKPGDWEIGWHHGGAKSPVVTVTAPLVKSVAIAGSGNMTIDRVDTDAFQAAIAGSGDMELTSVRAKSLDLAVRGSGNLNAHGTAEAAKIAVAGSGDIDAEGLTSTRASLSAAGSGNVSATVSGDAAIAVTGSGDVDVKGTDRCTITKSGSGEANCAR